MKHKPTYVVNFLRSTIGYAKDDCAIQLASSNSGLRFLGLAATLHCTASNFIGAQALELMITSSAGQNQELPTVPQLQELLSAVEYKVNRTGFAESIIGWET
jgi:predicted nucleotidyltransferase